MRPPVPRLRLPCAAAVWLFACAAGAGVAGEEGLPAVRPPAMVFGGGPGPVVTWPPVVAGVLGRWNEREEPAGVVRVSDLRAIGDAPELARPGHPLRFCPSHRGDLYAPVVRAQGELRGAELVPASIVGRTLGAKGQLRADFWTDFDDTTRVGFQTVTSTWLNLAVDAEAHYWQQDRAQRPGERLGGTFWTGDLNLVGKVVTHPRGRVRTGLGAAWLVEDSGSTTVGYNGTLGIDVLLLKGFSAGFEFDYGKLGGDDLLRWRLEGGYRLPFAEVRAGWDDYKVGTEDRAGVSAGVLFRY